MSTPPHTHGPDTDGSDVDRPGTSPGTSVVGGLLAPSTLRPVELDLGTVFWVITGCFAGALVATGVVGLVGSIEGRTVAICATGFVLGFVAQGWLRWRTASQRRRAATG